MTASPSAPPVHSSVHTATSLNLQPAGGQVLTVITSRLVIAWRDGDLFVGFEMQRVRTNVLKRAHNDPTEPPAGRRSREAGAS